MNDLTYSQKKWQKDKIKRNYDFTTKKGRLQYYREVTNSEYDLKTTGGRIKYFRQIVLGYTQLEMARLIKKERSYISMVEKNKVKIKADTSAILKKLGMDLN